MICCIFSSRKNLFPYVRCLCIFFCQNNFFIEVCIYNRFSVFFIASCNVKDDLIRTIFFLVPFPNLFQTKFNKILTRVLNIRRFLIATRFCRAACRIVHQNSHRAVLLINIDRYLPCAAAHHSVFQIGKLHNFVFRHMPDCIYILPCIRCFVVVLKFLARFTKQLLICGITITIDPVIVFIAFNAFHIVKFPVGVQT